VTPTPFRISLVALAWLALCRPTVGQAEPGAPEHRPSPDRASSERPRTAPERLPGPFGAGTSLSLALSVADRLDGRRELAGTVALGLPTDRWLAPRARPAAASAGGPGPGSEAAPLGAAGSARATASAQPNAALPPGAANARLEPCDEKATPSNGAAAAAQRGSERPQIARLRPRDARAAVQAGLAAAGLGDDGDDLDDLARRARWSAALPELRLRVSRLVDESASLSPTEYDAERETASGGTSLVLEARGTWMLDRAIFADQEIQIARLRQQLDEERRRVGQAVLGLLLEWQRALLGAVDQAAAPEACWASWLRVEQLGIELDLVTGGWFERWVRGDPARRPKPQCLDP
jgi:hypothetical protein